MCQVIQERGPPARCGEVRGRGPARLPRRAEAQGEKVRWERVRRASLLLFESPSDSSALSGLAPELIQDKGLQELHWGRRIKRNHKKLHCDSPIHFLPLHSCSGLRASSCREMAQKQRRREGLKGFGANREPLCPELFFFLVKAVNILGRTWKALCSLWCHRWRGREASGSWAERTKRSFPRPKETLCSQGVPWGDSPTAVPEPPVDQN